MSVWPADCFSRWDRSQDREAEPREGCRGRSEQSTRRREGRPSIMTELVVQRLGAEGRRRSYRRGIHEG